MAEAVLPPVVFSTKEQLPYPRSKDVDRLFCPIISIDHLSQYYQDLPVDEILALGDQKLLRKVCQWCDREQLCKKLLRQSITEPANFGPLVDQLYIVLHTLETRPRSGGVNERGPCEVLLYLSGHGIDPGNVCLVPDAIKPHPARGDLRKKDPGQCYGDTELEEAYLHHFYKDCANAIGTSPLGFVGGEVSIHQRGFIGVLGVLGLWCYTHHWEVQDKKIRHLVIVADCCFAGVWGDTLKSIMESKSDTLIDYRRLLHDYPVSIQCATNECEASHGGLFTPLWCFLNDPDPDSAAALKEYQEAYEGQTEPVRDDDLERQHPQYISTSQWQPSWKCFDPGFFSHLSGKQLEELKCDLRRKDGSGSPLTRLYMKALKSDDDHLRETLEKKQQELRNLEKYPERNAAECKSAEDCIATTKQSLADLWNFDFLFQSARSTRSFVLDINQDKLTTAHRNTLKRRLPCRDAQKPIPHGVYVFQGGQGDMSLIVTPHQKTVILIDGTKTADCFKAAWKSILRYLPRITHIVVTHHDDDHTTGIQLLLARYYLVRANQVERANLPDLTGTTIYMNTRAVLRVRNFRHEREIETLAERFGLEVEPVIVPDDQPKTLFNEGNLLVKALLPSESLVKEVQCSVPEEGKDTTGQVDTKGDTTAANVLSINLVAVWKDRDAYLFTGDAHLMDVTRAARGFLSNHQPRIRSFKYVDVPHHGSKSSNVTDVVHAHRGLADIPAENYLISHHGNHQKNPSFQTVFDILQSDECKKLHFLYPERKKSLSCGQHDACTSWHCPKCVTQQQQGKIDTTLQNDGAFTFFPF